MARKPKEADQVEAAPVELDTELEPLPVDDLPEIEDLDETESADVRETADAYEADAMQTLLRDMSAFPHIIARFPHELRTRIVAAMGAGQ